MKNDTFEYWRNPGTLFDSMKELTEINTQAFTKLAGQQQALMTNLSEAWARQIQLATDSKGYAELLSGQVNLVAKQPEKLLAIVSATASVLEATRAELTAWVEKGFKAATQPLSEVSDTERAEAVTQPLRKVAGTRFTPTPIDD